MTLLAILACALLTLTVGFFLAAPLFAPPTSVSFALETEKLELATRRAAVYATLQELEFDRTSGKLTEEDYGELKERYTTEAVELLRRLDELSRSSGPPRRA
jgi:hypothetical protein